MPYSHREFLGLTLPSRKHISKLAKLLSALPRPALGLPLALQRQREPGGDNEQRQAEKEQRAADDEPGRFE